jgi:hypothetical protein
MATKSRDLFLTIRSEGAILPPDLLQRIVAGDSELEGLKPDDYHLPKSEKLNEATSRSWNRLLGAWASFRPAAEKLPDSELGTSLTRERWLLPLFQELGYGRLLTAKAIEADGKSYAISHGWNRTPIHLLGCRVDLDRPQQRTATTSRSSPHSLLQETLNRSKEHLWGFVTNGLRFRVLRNNASLTRQAYVEFDLEAMMLGENYADFVLLWLLCHQSRVEAENPNDCWLEKWSQASKERGVRALEQLRRGVEQAITALGRGFLSCQVNRKLREDLRSGALNCQDYYRQLLRLVYRLLFLFSAEDRGLLLTPGEQYIAARERYLAHYSTLRLRRMAERRTGTRHNDLFASLRLIMGKLGMDSGCPELALPALGSFLFSGKAMPDLETCDISNFDLLEAFRALAITVSNGIRRPVDYKNLGAEELGSVYESLLELHPRVNLDSASFELSVASGHERKTTGSYYTPTSLIDCLLDSALEPVLDEAARKAEPEKSILGLKVVDPACGSGHFLIAAAHRIAKRLATARTGDEEPSPEAVKTALRDVMGHCIYGVDINPMAVELCKVNLWMEALEPGKPLSFLEGKIKCGNALLGTTPALLNGGIPDAAFSPLEGDSREACTKWKKVNKAERTSRERKQERFAFDAPWMKLGKFAESFLAVDDVGDESIEQIHQKELLYEQAVRSGDYLDGRFLADAWCAAFVWKKTSLLEFPITEEIFRQIEQNPTAFYNDKREMSDEIRQLARSFNFLHWHLSFPDVFRPTDDTAPHSRLTGWSGGFDVVLGNPPWVRQELLKSVKPLFTTFQSFCSTVDSSVLFLERAVQIGRQGCLVGLLTPNKWFRAAYGEQLRVFLRENTRVDLLVDFGHSHDLFPEQDTFPAASVLEPVNARVSDDEPLRFVRAHDSDRAKLSLKELMAQTAVVVRHKDLRPDRWQLENTNEGQLLDRLLDTGTSLAKYLGCKPIRGILTGLNEAYYVTTIERNALVEEDPTCEPLFKQFLRGRDIKRWNAEWDGQWHIVIQSSHNTNWPWSNVGSEDAAEAVFAQTYSSVHAHMKRFEDKLRKRSDKGTFWWELRSCDYYESFDQPKIVVQCIAYFSRFALDLAGRTVNNKVLFLPSGDLYLLGILNSRISWWVINRTFQHMKDDGLSIDVQFLLALPVPAVLEELREAIAGIVRSLVEGTASSDTASEVDLNQLVERAFGLSVEERQILEASLPARDPIVTLGIAESMPAEEAVDDSVAVDPILALGSQGQQRPAILLQTVSPGAWTTPAGVTPDNLALLTLVEVMRAFGGDASQVQVRLAAALVRKPAHALAFLEDAQARDWVRAIGNEARPLPSNVFNISQFRPAAADLPWSNAVAQLTGTGALRTTGDRWVIGSNSPLSSGESWIAGRAAFAVDLVSKVASGEAEQKMASFLRSVEDGTAARRAIS